MAAKATANASSATTGIIVTLGTAGTLSVDPTKFTDAVRDYIFTYGLKQMLNDAHASVTAKTNPEDADRSAAKVAMAEKKLASLYEGNVAQARVGGGKSPLETELARMGETKVKQAIKLNGKKISDYAKIMPELTAKMVEKHRAEWTPIAERVIAERASAPEIEVPDLDALLGEVKA